MKVSWTCFYIALKNIVYKVIWNVLKSKRKLKSKLSVKSISKRKYIVEIFVATFVKCYYNFF